MKHIFVVETADNVLIGPIDADNLTLMVEKLVKSVIGLDHFAYCQSIRNQQSAIRGVYRLFAADQTQSPDQLGSAE